MPETLHSFNVYDMNDKLLGQTGEIKLPNFNMMTETISGAGILGEYDAPVVGQFQSLTMEINFRTLNSALSQVMRETSDFLYLRGDQQYYDHTDGRTKHIGLKITIRRRPRAFDSGKMERATVMNSKVTLELYYIKIEDTTNRITLIEFDRFNFIYIVNDEDLLEEVRRNI
jgi:P2 family phage contractile tail tube protein